MEVRIPSMQAFILLLAVTLSACAAFQADEITNSWKGHPLDKMILSWGAPAQVYTVSDGQRTATFSHARFIDGTQYFCNVTVGTDVAGIIKTTRVDGNLGGCNYFFADKSPAPE